MKKEVPASSVGEGEEPRSSHLNFPVVGLGASAGGLKALLRFFEHMPNGNGMAFVVIMHLSPKHESNIAQILQGVTKMPVRQVTRPMLIEKNHIYVISPALHLSMSDGHLRVREPEPSYGRHIAIDLFLRTLADVHREHAIGIVLSGTGSDGSVGLARVKEQGGVTLAQAPEDAEYDSMPRNAIATKMVDFVLPVVEMPQKLIELWENVQVMRMPADIDVQTPVQSPETKEESRAAELALRDVIVLLRTRTGHDFKHYKRATVLRRIERRMQVNRLSDLPAYRDFLQNHPEETASLLDDMLIGVTNFFRDREAFEALERSVIPRLFDLPKDADPQVRVWSAGCSTGEEAYSLAILLTDYADLQREPTKVQVFATDIDEQSISVGRSGVYAEAIVTDIAPQRLRQYFSKEQSYYRIKKEIRERVLFALHNLLRDPPFSRLHMISCRNLLIYLDREVQANILQMFHFALKPGGYLFLGSSESADVCADLFSPVDKKNRIYRAKAVTGLLRQASAMSLNSFQDLKTPLAEKILDRRKISFAEIHQRVLEQYAPPSVVVNHESVIIHMSDRAGRFLRYVGGEPSFNLLSLVHPELRLELRTTLFQAIQTGKSIEARRVQMLRDGRTFYVNMVARPFRDTDADFVLVLFDEVEDTMSNEAKAPRDDSKDNVLSRLEDELQRTKDQLQSTVEQSETSTEELKASNEELQAINEELRSTTEELETSKEELQSINEELITVNQELKSKVEETSKINDDLQNLIASTDIATVFVDRRMRIKWHTPRATEIFSIIPSDTGRSLLDITHRLQYERMADDAIDTFESLRIIEREVRSNDNRWYIARLLPYRTTEDRIDGAVLTFIDITARRQAEERLSAEEERMRLVAESTKDYIIITLDTDGLITSWNRGAERAFGYGEAEVRGHYFDLIYQPEDRLTGMPSKEMRRAREEGRAEDERWLLRKDGTLFFCSGVMTPLQNEDLQHGYAKIGRDVTEQKRQVDEHESQLEQSQISSQLKDEFFAVMSHELKHPLNLIQLNAELISRLPQVRTHLIAAKSVDVIVGAIRSQARIIDDLLDLSRINTGKLQLNRNAVSFRQVVGEIVEVLRNDPENRQISVEPEPEEAPELVIDADGVRVEQIVWNLVNNAFKFTEPGGRIVLRLSREGAMARLDVEDDGMGIAAEYLAQVFDMFGQVPEKRIASTKKGLGVGLALVRQLVEAHQGRVEAASDGLGKGATFSVWLPLHREPDRQPAPLVPSRYQALAGKNVLLVDDSRDICETMGMLLQSEGAEVAVALSGAAALELAAERDFDLVLSDIGMPGMSGIQLIAALRQQDRYADTVAIALTGYGAATDVHNALTAGFDAHLDKPVDFKLLLETAINLLGRPRR